MPGMACEKSVATPVRKEPTALESPACCPEARFPGAAREFSRSVVKIIVQLSDSPVELSCSSVQLSSSPVQLSKSSSSCQIHRRVVMFTCTVVKIIVQLSNSAVQPSNSQKIVKSRIVRFARYVAPDPAHVSLAPPRSTPSKKWF